MNLPAGIEKGFEIYRHDAHLRVLINGKRIDYTDLSMDIRSIFIREMTNSQRVLSALHEMGCTANEMETKFVGCRFGSLNETPDLIHDQLIPDAPVCESIGHCPGYGIVCLIPSRLTRQEYQIVYLIGLGKQDKEICDSLNIALPTCHTYKERIREKLQVNNRIEIALWAHQSQII